MTIEGGGRAGMIAPDETTFEWIRGRPAAPADFDATVQEWRALRTDDAATFDRDIEIDAGDHAARDLGHQPRAGGPGDRQRSAAVR